MRVGINFLAFTNSKPETTKAADVREMYRIRRKFHLLLYHYIDSIIRYVSCWENAIYVQRTAWRVVIHFHKARSTLAYKHQQYAALHRSVAIKVTINRKRCQRWLTQRSVQLISVVDNTNFIIRTLFKDIYQSSCCFTSSIAIALLNADTLTLLLLSQQLFYHKFVLYGQ